MSLRSLLYVFFLLFSLQAQAQETEPGAISLSSIFDKAACGCELDAKQLNDAEYAKTVLKNFRLKPLVQSFEVEGSKNNVAIGIINSFANVSDERSLKKAIDESRKQLSKKPKKDQFVDNMQVELLGLLGGGNYKAKGKFAACYFAEEMHRYYLKYPQDCGSNNAYCLRYSGANSSEVRNSPTTPIQDGNDSTATNPTTPSPSASSESGGQSPVIFVLLLVLGLGFFAFWKWGEKLGFKPKKPMLLDQEKPKANKVETEKAPTPAVENNNTVALKPKSLSSSAQNSKTPPSLQIKEVDESEEPKEEKQPKLPVEQTPKEQLSEREKEFYQLVQDYRGLADKQEAEISRLRGQVQELQKMLDRARAGHLVPQKPLPQMPAVQQKLPLTPQTPVEPPQEPALEEVKELEEIVPTVETVEVVDVEPQIEEQSPEEVEEIEILDMEEDLEDEEEEELLAEEEEEEILEEEEELAAQPELQAITKSSAAQWFFLLSPKGNSFASEEVQAIASNKTLYKMRIDSEDGLFASFYLRTEPDMLQALQQDSQQTEQLLAATCAIQGLGKMPNTLSQMPGLLRKDGQNWVIERRILLTW